MKLILRADKGWWHLWACGAVGVGLSAFLGVAPNNARAIPQEGEPNSVSSFDSNSTPTTTLQKQLLEVLAELRRARSESYQRQREVNEQKQQWQERIEKLEGQVAELRQEEEALDKQIAELDKTISEIMAASDAASQQYEELNKAVGRWKKQAAERVSTGMPWQREERLGRLNLPRLKEQAESTTVVESLTDIWNFFQEEMRLGQSGETLTMQVELPDERQVHVRGFHVGHAVMGYVSEDGQATGFWRRAKTGGRWDHALDAATAEAVRKTARILDRQEEPVLVGLPVLMGPAAGIQEHDAEQN